MSRSKYSEVAGQLGIVLHWKQLDVVEQVEITLR